MLDVVVNGKQLNEAEILCQLEKIVKMSGKAEERLPPFGILTSDGRTEWAQARDVLTKGLSWDKRSVLETVFVVTIVVFFYFPLRTKQQRLTGPDRELPVCGVPRRTQRPGSQ